MTQCPLTELLQKYSTERLRHLRKHNVHSFVLLSSISVSSLTTSTATGGGGCCCCWCGCWFCWGLSCCCGGGGFLVHSFSYPNKTVKVILFMFKCKHVNDESILHTISLHYIHLSLSLSIQNWHNSVYTVKLVMNHCNHHCNIINTLCYSYHNNINNLCSMIKSWKDPIRLTGESQILLKFRNCDHIAQNKPIKPSN